MAVTSDWVVLTGARVRRLLRTSALLAVLVLVLGAATPPATRAHLLVSPPGAGPAADAPAPLAVVALGDSVPAGTGCDCAAFPERYAGALAGRAGRRVAVTNDGVPGQTSPGLLGALQDGQPAASDVAAADVVTITIGANDFDYTADPSCPGGAVGCYQPELDALPRTVDAILARVAALRRQAPTTVLLTGYWDIWQDGRVAAAGGGDYVATGDALTGGVNRQIQQAAARDHATYVDLVTPFRGTTSTEDDSGLLADDGDHPNASGHQVIADALIAATPGKGTATEPVLTPDCGLSQSGWASMPGRVTAAGSAARDRSIGCV